MNTNREYCVLCEEENKLITITTCKMPLYAIYPENIDQNITWDMTYGYCEQCLSTQLKTLLDPNILYDKNYIQPNSESYNWVQHNISFIDFIVKCVDINCPLIEVGSSSFVLGRHLTRYFKDYTVFDYSLDQAIRRDNIKYIEGNCENYNFPKDSNIIMSHVFEHLYEPKKFIANCKRNNVKQIIIAIPDMENINMLHVFNQHTFTYSIVDIEYIFGLSHYKATRKLRFNTNDNSFPALFFQFELSNSIIEIERPLIESRHIYMKNLLKPIQIPKNTFLATAGMMMLPIYSIIENKENIIGVIDQNKILHGKKYANTTHHIHPYEYLKNYDENTTILVFSYRKNDIINCIRNVNTEINIMVI